MHDRCFKLDTRFNSIETGSIRTGFPNLSLTMHPFSNSTDEHVPLNYRYIYNKHVMIFENNIH